MSDAIVTFECECGTKSTLTLSSPMKSGQMLGCLSCGRLFQFQNITMKPEPKIFEYCTHGYLVCHRCNHNIELSNSCPECGFGGPHYPDEYGMQTCYCGAMWPESRPTG